MVKLLWHCILPSRPQRAAGSSSSTPTRKPARHSGRTSARRRSLRWSPVPRPAPRIASWGKAKWGSFAFIDTAPAVESPALAAVRAADFCLIVSRPGILDLRSIGINVQIAKLAGKPVALVINAAPASGAQGVAAGEDAGTRYGVEVCPIIIHQRAVFGHALARSRCAQEVEPAGKAAAEVAALWEWLAQRTSIGTAPERLSA